MSGTFKLAPGVDISWLGDLSESDVLKNFEIQGGQPCWRPHIPGDVQALLKAMGQQVIIDGNPVPWREIPEAGYPLLQIEVPDDDPPYVPLSPMIDPATGITP